MVSTELVEQLRRLDRVDKLEVIQLLAAELANEENEQQEQYILWLNDTRQKVAVGLEEIERGDVLDTEVVINQLKEKLLQKREAQT